MGVFWDIENCSVPTGRSAGAVVQRIRSNFFQGHREAEFICVCDISKESKAVIQELNNCQVHTTMALISYGFYGYAVNVYKMRISSHVSALLLHKVTVAHINATAKNAADDKLRQSLRRFAETHTAPATVVLVSCEFSSDSEKNYSLPTTTDFDCFVFINNSGCEFCK